jgi:hypothetical protein
VTSNRCGQDPNGGPWTANTKKKNEWSTSSSHAPKLTISDDFVGVETFFSVAKYYAAAGYLNLSGGYLRPFFAYLA